MKIKVKTIFLRDKESTEEIMLKQGQEYKRSYLLTHFEMHMFLSMYTFDKKRDTKRAN